LAHILLLWFKFFLITFNLVNGKIMDERIIAVCSL
jgi:hypothetical protein